MNSFPTLSIVSDTTQFSDEIILTKSLPLTRYQVYSSHSTNSNKKYALKIFPYEEGEPSQDYLNESRFANLSHRNIIKVLHTEKDARLAMLPQKRGSYILTELAEFGDFHDLLVGKKVVFDEKMARFFFRQLIEGIEYLHSQSITHLDIKPANLILNAGMELKIIDFELSYKKDDSNMRSLGSKNYRAPELIISNVHNPEATDIFSAAVVVFMMISRGVVPIPENAVYNGLNLLDLLLINEKKFWEIHSKKVNFSEEFKELFSWMTKREYDDRASIANIKASAWYRGDVYTKEEMAVLMSQYM